MFQIHWVSKTWLPMSQCHWNFTLQFTFLARQHWTGQIEGKFNHLAYQSGYRASFVNIFPVRPRFQADVPKWNGSSRRAFFTPGWWKPEGEWMENGDLPLVAVWHLDLLIALDNKFLRKGSYFNRNLASLSLVGSLMRWVNKFQNRGHWRNYKNSNYWWKWNQYLLEELFETSFKVLSNQVQGSHHQLLFQRRHFCST